MEEDWQRDLERWLEPYLKELGNKRGVGCARPISLV